MSVTRQEVYWGPTDEREDKLLPLPVAADGGMHAVPAQATRQEARFFAALVAFAPTELIDKAIAYAMGDAA